MGDLRCAAGAAKAMRRAAVQNADRRAVQILPLVFALFFGRNVLRIAEQRETPGIRPALLLLLGATLAAVATALLLA